MNDKYLNAKVRCVDVGLAPWWFTAGEIYDVVDGVLTTDRSVLFFEPRPVKKFEELNSWSLTQFELVTETNQTYKQDKGKSELSLVPPAIIEAVGEVRTYGVKKYAGNECWRKVEPKRYKDALIRHMCEYMRDDKAVDGESGIEHLKHIACNVAFLLELEREVNNENNNN